MSKAKKTKKGSPTATARSSKPAANPPAKTKVLYPVLAPPNTLQSNLLKELVTAATQPIAEETGSETEYTNDSIKGKIVGLVNFQWSRTKLRRARGHRRES
jgi:hypothetical protein